MTVDIAQFVVGPIAGFSTLKVLYEPIIFIDENHPRALGFIGDVESHYSRRFPTVLCRAAVPCIQQSPALRSLAMA